MSERIHEILAEIKTIEEMLGSLSGPMHELALEEQKNLQFELEMLQRNAQKHVAPQHAFMHYASEADRFE